MAEDILEPQAGKPWRYPGLRLAPNFDCALQDILTEAQEYFWFTTDEGRIRNDPNPNKPFDPEAAYNSILVHAANERLETEGADDFYSDLMWKEAGKYLGLSDDEAKVITVCAEHEDIEDVREVQKRYWMEDARVAIEEALLSD